MYRDISIQVKPDQVEVSEGWYYSRKFTPEEFALYLARNVLQSRGASSLHIQGSGVDEVVVGYRFVESERLGNHVLFATNRPHESGGLEFLDNIRNSTNEVSPVAFVTWLGEQLSKTSVVIEDIIDFAIRAQEPQKS